MHDGARYFELSRKKPDYSEFPVEINIAKWLEDETVNVATFTAENLTLGTDATADVIDDFKSRVVDADIYFVIKAGTVGHKYRATCQIETNDGNKEEFYLDWEVE